MADGNDPEALIEVGGETVDLSEAATSVPEAARPAFTSYAGEAPRINAAKVAAGLVE